MASIFVMLVVVSCVANIFGWKTLFKYLLFGSTLWDSMPQNGDTW